MRVSTPEPATPKPSSEERRKTQRVGLITQVECTTTGDYALGRSKDISEGGLLVVTEKTFDLRTEVVVRLNLPPYPPGTHIEAKGLVMWVRPAESMGVEFFQLQEQQREAIAKYIQLQERITALGPL